MSMRRGYKQYLVVWLCLMGLLALTFGSAYLHMGVWNSVANFVIAAIKAALVAVFFMHLATSRGLIRIFAVAALFALALLFALSGSDYATRAMHWAPWQSPQQLPPILGPRE
jgi:cytochrome c oxidase subunit 4